MSKTLDLSGYRLGVGVWDLAADRGGNVGEPLAQSQHTNMSAVCTCCGSMPACRGCKDNNRIELCFPSCVVDFI